MMTEWPSEPRESTPRGREENIDLSQPTEGFPGKGKRPEAPIRQKVEDKAETEMWEASIEDD